MVTDRTKHPDVIVSSTPILEQLSTPGAQGAIRRSFVTVPMSTAIGTGVDVPLAYVLARRSFPGKRPDHRRGYSHLRAMGEFGLSGTVRRVRDLGRRYDVTVRTKTGAELLVEQHARPPAVDESVTVAVPKSTRQLFDQTDDIVGQ